MTGMGSRACGKEVEEGGGWTTSSPTSLEEVCLASWADRDAAGTEEDDEEKTWFTHSS